MTDFVSTPTPEEVNASDPEYVEKMRKRAIDYYYKKKQERQNTAE
jgi:hypothetical protein